MVLTVLIIRYRTKSLRHTNQILREKEKIAEEVRRQRDQLSLAHKNLTDSIRYAQKIQQALLPSDYYFQRLLPESFILFLPKDMVSGDFYWITGREGRIFFTVADCTGHGVPGAFMSMIGFEILDKIINDQKVDKPAEILNILNQGIAATFSRGEENILLKDGMDLAFCALDRENRLLEFAGAFNPLYLIRDNNLIEYKADRFSVGLGEEENQRFTNHKLSLISGDKIYMFSDGYADQFGGPQGKKFMYRRFRHLLLSIHHLPLDQQKTIIYDTFLAWKGDLEQVDDILIIGVEPLVAGNNSVQ
ncbi:MAG: SpoIIE family protein phosphatase [Chlorobi bacterium]|nr:SpoIIE family protein phosphatase [Chlorobiota bacterium]